MALHVRLTFPQSKTERGDSKESKPLFSILPSFGLALPAPFRPELTNGIMVIGCRVLLR